MSSVNFRPGETLTAQKLNEAFSLIESVANQAVASSDALSARVAALVSEISNIDLELIKDSASTIMSLSSVVARKADASAVYTKNQTDNIVASALMSSLAGYATTEDVTSRLSSYATLAALNQAITAVRVDLTPYATKSYVASAIADIDYSAYATKAYVNGAVNSIDLGPYATKSYVNSAISNINIGSYATTAYVNSAINNIDLSSYATTSYVNNAVNSIDLSSYVTNAALSAAISPLATVAYVDTAIANASISGDGDGSTIDLTPYALKTYVDASIAAIDLSSYATKSYVDSAIDDLDFSSYATKSYVDTSIDDLGLSNYATKSYVDLAIEDIDLSSYATKTYVNAQIDAIDLSGYTTKSYVDNLYAQIDLTNYATKDYVDDAIANSSSGSSNVSVDEILEEGTPIATISVDDVEHTIKAPYTAESHIEVVVGDAATNFNPIDDYGLPAGPYEYLRFYFDDLDAISSGELDGASVILWDSGNSEYDWEYDGPGSLDTTVNVFDVDDWGEVASLAIMCGQDHTSFSDILDYVYTRNDGTVPVPYYQVAPGKCGIYVPTFGDIFNTLGTFQGYTEYAEILDNHLAGVYFGTAREMMPDPNMTIIVLFMEKDKYAITPTYYNVFENDPLTITSASGVNNVAVVFEDNFDPTTLEHTIHNDSAQFLDAAVLDDTYCIISLAYVHDAEHTPTDIVYDIPTSYWTEVEGSQDAIIDLTDLPCSTKWGTCIYSPFGRVEAAIRVYDNPEVRNDKEVAYSNSHFYCSGYDKFNLKLLELSSCIDYLCQDMYTSQFAPDLTYKAYKDVRYSQRLVSKILRYIGEEVAPITINAVDPETDDIKSYETRYTADAFCHHAISIVSSILLTIIDAGNDDESELQDSVEEILGAADEDSYVHTKLNRANTKPRTGLEMRYRCLYKLAKFVKFIVQYVMADD